MKINKVNYENFVIDYLEGSLSPDLKAEFDSFLQVNPNVYEEIKLYLSAPVLAEPNETVFAEKDLLKRRVISYRWLGSLAAAVAVLLIGSFFFFNGTDNQVNVASIPDTVKETPAHENTILQKNSNQIRPVNPSTTVENKDIAALENKDATIKKNVLDMEKPSLKVLEENAPILEEGFEVNENSNQLNAYQLASTDTYQPAKKEQNFSSQTKKAVRESLNIEDIKALPFETVATIENTHVIYVPNANYAFNVEAKETTKNNKIIDLFMTKAYDDVDLKEAIVANNLDRLNISKDKIREMILPESILN